MTRKAIAVAMLALVGITTGCSGGGSDDGVTEIRLMTESEYEQEKFQENAEENARLTPDRPEGEKKCATPALMEMLGPNAGDLGWKLCP